MSDKRAGSVSDNIQPSGMSRRSLVRYGAAGLGLAAVGGGAVVYANRPPISPRQQDLPRLPDWTEADIPDMRGRTAVVTGGNGFPEGDRSSLGFHDALQLAGAGANVVIASRRQERGEEAVRQIKTRFPAASIRFERLDLADTSSVAGFAERMRATHSSLDILINNAGVMGRRNREVSVDGFERVFATNALGHFSLTAHLLPLLRAGVSPRVVWVSSSRTLMGAIDFSDLQLARGYEYGPAYDNSKLALLLFAFEMQRRSTAQGWGVSSLAAHPGIARTHLVPDGPGPDSLEGRSHRYAPFMFQTAAQGALPSLYAATSPQAVAGAYYGPNGFGELRGLPGWAGIPEAADDPKLAGSLWTALEQLSGVRFG